MARENKFVVDLQKMRVIDLKVGELRRAYVNTNDEDHMRLMEAEIDRLIDERARLLGLPEDEIARINQESEDAVEAQAKAEIEQFLWSLGGGAKQ